MRKIYSNYNQVYVDVNNPPGKKTIVKFFRERICWENETKTISLLNENGFSVPRLLEARPCRNVYEFIEGELLSDVLKRGDESFEEVLDLSDKLSLFNSSGFRRDSNGKNRIQQALSKLNKDLSLTSISLKRIERLLKEYSSSANFVIHGDFRPDNILITERGPYLLDLEFSCVSDRNKDFAYFWLGSVARNKRVNHRLKKLIENHPHYNEIAFNFWSVYMHLMILINPNIPNRSDWLKNLEQLVS